MVPRLLVRDILVLVAVAPRVVVPIVEGLPVVGRGV